MYPHETQKQLLLSLPCIQLLIFDCDYVSKMLQEQPKLLAMLKVASDEYKDTKKGLREIFCRVSSYISVASFIPLLNYLLNKNIFFSSLDILDRNFLQNFLNEMI